jgi:hypothetical protein
LAQHDLLVAAGPETEEEVEAAVDGLLLGRAAEAPGEMVEAWLLAWAGARSIRTCAR